MFIAIIEVIADNVDDALSPVTMPVVGKVLASTLLGVVLSGELLLDDASEGCLGDSLDVDRNVRFLDVAERLFGNQSSLYAPISTQDPVSDSSLSISTSYGTPAGFV